MKKVVAILFSTLLCLAFAPQEACAQGAAPGLFNVGEVIVNYVTFEDPKASDSCGLSREQIFKTIKESFIGTTVPATAVVDANPPVVGVARIQLFPEISTHIDENMNCVSWISMSAESRANVLILPVTSPRNVTIIYWRQHTKAVSGQSLHPRKVSDAITKMVEQFAQQYRVDQPAALQK